MIEWHTKAREMRKAGAKSKEIAAALGKADGSVRHVLACYLGDRRITWTPNRISKFRTLWLAGMPTAKMARRFNLVGTSNVSAVAAQFKLPPRHQEYYRWTPELENELRELWAKRCSRKGSRKAFRVQDIAEHFNTIVPVIRTAAERLGLPRRLHIAIPWTPEQDRQLRKLWPQTELSIAEIAGQLGHSYRGVIGRRPKLGLPPRKPGTV